MNLFEAIEETMKRNSILLKMANCIFDALTLKLHENVSLIQSPNAIAIWFQHGIQNREIYNRLLLYFDSDNYINLLGKDPSELAIIGDRIFSMM